MRITFTRLAMLLAGALALPLVSACAPIETRVAAPSSGMPSLDGDAAIDAYLAKLEDAPMPVSAMDAEADSMSDQVVVVTGSAVKQSITNTQEAGVDEGGIVKRRGDHLVVLRRGRLFSVALGNGAMEPVDVIDAFPPSDDDPGDTWYDEMLIAGDTVIVIGYSYGDRGTEVSRFDLSAAGQFTYRDTHYLTSGDYYSSRNYASRLIGDELLFYTPIAFDSADWRDDLPSMRARAADGSLSEPRRNDGASRIYLPQRYLDAPYWGTDVLHTVTSCRLGAAELPCRSTMVLGGWSRDFYFSPGSAYVWVDQQHVYSVAPQDENDAEEPVEAILYRIPLDGSAPTAIGAQGSPVDQFSFRENSGRDNAGGSIDILVRAGDYGGGMWGGEVSEGDPMLLQLPLDALGDGSQNAGKDLYRSLPPVDGWRFFNRFVGRHLLYAAGSYGDEEEAPQAYIVPLDRDWVVAMPLPHGITRFDTMGSDAVAIGPSGEDALGFSSIALDATSGAARLANTYLMPNAQEGETRSQALFYRPDLGSDSGADGTLGLPVSREIRDDGGELLGDASAIAFLRRDDRVLSLAGTLEGAAAHRGKDAADNCEASCTDWYGNARPIFIGDRIFALMGYEIVEGRMNGDRIVEVRRVDFTPR